MTLEQMQKRAQEALENGWDKVSLPAEAILALRNPPPRKKTLWEKLRGA